ncbi:MAG: diguanylate cyclase [Gemmatimonadaceae bacterium]|nr:diguanylate cyclase [Gemmatimonadaceae bacterium]
MNDTTDPAPDFRSSGAHALVDGELVAAGETESVESLIAAGQAHEQGGETALAREAYRRALGQLDGDLEARRRVSVLRWIARTHQADAAYDQALESLDAAEQLATAIADRAGFGHCRNVRANISWQRGDLDGAVALYTSALDAAHEVRDAHLAAVASQNLGVVASARGAFDQAFHHYRASIAAYRSLGHPRDTAIAQNNLGRLYLDQGDCDAAEVELTEAHTLALSVGDVNTATMIEINLADAWHQRGDCTQARALCRQAQSRLAPNGDTHADGEVQKLLGAIAIACHDPEAAERHFVRAEEIAARREDLLLRAQIARERAELYRGQGRTRELLQSLNGAHQLFTQLRANQQMAAVTALIRRLERDVLEVVRKWGESIEEKDAYTQGHCERVADLACALARRAGVEEDMIFWFRIGALLHDVGKIVISSEILNKTDGLTPDEWDVMKLHPGAGADILREINFPYDVNAIVRHHHENWDGTGYPDALGGERIPLWARIVCLADVYDALTSDRSYKQALPHEAAIEVMRNDVRRQFDPALFALFEDIARTSAPRTVEGAAPRRPDARVTDSAAPLDDLTGLVLRKGFLAQATQVLDEAATRAQSVSLAVIDVDHFKSVNDTFGHLQGDDVLRSVAGLLRDSVRRQDIVGRYAGDEFVLLFPDTPLAEARQLAERLCEAVAANRLAIRERREGTIGVTLSIGVATADAGESDLEAVFAAADRALYLAKRRGRNQVASATEADGETQKATLRFDRFVGRVRELRSLLAQLEHACAGRPRLVAIVGEAGIGKTSLVRQLQPEVRLRGGTMVFGRCLASDVKPPYGAWAEVITAIHALGIVPPREWKELPRLVPALGAATDQASPAGSKYALLAEVAEYLREASAVAPLTVVLDDVQWADSSTWDATEYVRHNLSDEKLLICMTMRSEDLAGIAERRRHLSRDERFSDLALNRFSPDELSSWLETILHQGEIAREFLRFIHTYTEGNPLLVVHVLRALQENGGVWHAERRWQWKDNPELELPTAVSDLIDARIDRLSETARQHLTVAAVVGRTFDVDLVLSAGDMSEDELLDAIDEGVAAHVLESAGDRAADRYSFSHGLIGDAIRRRVNRRRLARMHGLVATAMEALHPDAVSAIAAHFDAAGNGEKAYEYAMRAAERAVAVYAHHEAAASYAMAERHAATAEARMHCRFRHALALELAGAYEEAESLCDLIIAEHVSMGEPGALVSVRRVRERLRSLRGLALEQTCDAVEKLLAEAVQLGDEQEEVELLGMLSRAQARRGDPAEARRLARLSLEVAERVGEPGVLAKTLMYLGSSLLETEVDEALSCYRRALVMFVRIGDLIGQARAQINVGIAQSRLGANEESAQAYATALELGRTTHSPDITGLAALNLGVLKMKVGALDEADGCFTEAMERFALLNNEPHRLAALYNQANLARDREDRERAVRLYGDAAVVATAMDQLDVELGARAGQGLAFLDLGRVSDARGCLQSCAVRVRDRATWWFQGRELLEALAIRVHLQCGDASAARQRFESGLALAEASDTYGAAWLVADVAGPLAAVGVCAAHDQVPRFAALAEGLAYAPLTARYAALLARPRTDAGD